MSALGFELVLSKCLAWAPGGKSTAYVMRLNGRDSVVIHPEDLWRLKPEPTFEPDADFPRDCPPVSR